MDSDSDEGETEDPEYTMVQKRHVCVCMYVCIYVYMHTIGRYVERNGILGWSGFRNGCHVWAGPCHTYM